jgi:Na+(H+)/acetate symporter ActP
VTWILLTFGMAGLYHIVKRYWATADTDRFKGK